MTTRHTPRRNRRIGTTSRVGSTAWASSLSSRLPSDPENLHPLNITDMAPIEQQLAEDDHKPRGGWIVNRLRCLVRGHRQLTPTAAASKILANGVVKELNLCHACDSYVWRVSNRTLRPSWAELQEWSTAG
jgi:hypothetical protein